MLMMCLVFFAFTTILGWDYYSERCLRIYPMEIGKITSKVIVGYQFGSIYRTVHDSFCCMDHCGYL